MIRILLLMCFVLTPSLAHAQENAPRQERKPNPFFSKVDRDGDGSVSETEYLNHSKRQFKRLDTDNDGSVSESEYLNKGKTKSRKIDREALKERMQEIRQKRQDRQDAQDEQEASE